MRRCKKGRKYSLNPINPYGRSKIMIEHILQNFYDAYGMKHVILRYFNTAGAHESGELGWKAKYSLEKMIETAWKWHQSHPDGYRQ